MLTEVCFFISFNNTGKRKNLWRFLKPYRSDQSLSHVWLFATPWITACQATLSITDSQNLLKLVSIESMMPSSHLILCHPLLLLPSIFPSIRIFSKESAFYIRWPKYWNFSFSISPSSEYSGLISFRIDWLDLFAVQGTLRIHYFKTAPLSFNIYLPGSYIFFHSFSNCDSCSPSPYFLIWDAI